MTTPLVQSITDEQLAEIQREFARQSPCAHWNRSKVGLGRYHHCDDCGADVRTEKLESAQAASDRHDELASILAQAFDRLRAAEKDSQRLDWVIREQAVIYSMNGMSTPTIHHVVWPSLGEQQPEWFTSERQAIDEAMKNDH